MLDGVWLVHSSASGATMAADAVDAALLELLGDGPVSATLLTRRLSDAVQVLLPPDAVVGVESHLQGLLQHGWLVVLDD
ncbi:MAG TPA: hypothetical protein PKV56_18705 [Burkholderiaceae bacterium]|nr:hypothetical protein [Burkholderiaceae bacterium]